MSTLVKALLLTLPLLAGCFVEVDDPYDRSAPPQETYAAVAVDPEEEEVDHVVYLEYFGCSEEQVATFPHYRRYYGLTNDDIYFISFTSRQCGVSFDTCFHTYYYDCGRNYDRLVVYYHVPRERYFVAIGAGVSPPPMYARTYGAYRGGTYAHTTFTNQEYSALVHMKVGCDYQGQPPATYFGRVQATGSPHRVILDNRDQSGHGGRSATGAALPPPAPRPWTMPPQQKQQWHQERQATAVRTETHFKESHREQVAKVEKEHPTPPKRAAHDPEPKPLPRTPPAENPPRKQPLPRHVEDPPDRKPPPRQVEDPPDRKPPPRHVEDPPDRKPPPRQVEKPGDKPPPPRDPHEKLKDKDKDKTKDDRLQ